MSDEKRSRSSEDGNFLPAGNWGGEHVALEVSETGARIEFDCAHAAITERIKLDGRNEFVFEGVYVKERGGPLRPGQQPDSHPARYTGKVDGDKMTMTVTLTGGRQNIGTFTLNRGRSPSLFKCL